MMQIIENYKELLDLGSFEGLRYEDETKSRYESFKICLSHLSKIKDPNVLELGTCRSFRDGKFEGCNSNDPIFWDPNDPSKWDWGAGCFSLVFGQIINYGKITTVDLAPEHIYRCKNMTDSLNIKCEHVISDSVSFLRSTEEKYDLIYLDTGDMWPIDYSIKLQLEEAMIIVQRDLLKPQGLILIDDVLNGTPKEMGKLDNNLGKSEESIPYLSSYEYGNIFQGYQYIFKKI
jgi:hypothetical protein